MMLPDGPVLTIGQAVYVLHVPALGYFKVGRTSNPLGRVAQLQTGCPEAIELLGTSQIDDAGIPADIFETALHRALHPYRSHGEWFAKIGYDKVTDEWRRVWNDLVSENGATSTYSTGRMYQSIRKAPAAPIKYAGSLKLKRGRPKITEPRPWELVGMSRTSWYRRQRVEGKAK